jgi:hypothetical protein
VDTSLLKAELDEIFDAELLFHGFTPYMRDYELVVYQSVDPRSKLAPRHRRYLFRHCVQASVSSGLDPRVWVSSLSDELIETHIVTMESTGHVWGVNCQVLYPGATIIEPSPEATRWEAAVGVPFHEVRIAGNTHVIALVFSDLVVETVTAGYTPYTVTADGAAERYAQGTKHPLSP